MMGGPSPYGAAPMTASVANKPTAAFVLSLIGGIIILLWGGVLLAIGAAFPAATFGTVVAGIFTLAAIELITGFLVVGFGVALYASPYHHVGFGIVILVASIASLIAGGGLFLGFVLGLIAGILGIVHKPQLTVVMAPPPGYYPPMNPAQSPYGQPLNSPGYSPYAPPPPPAGRFCPSCGAPNSPGATFCGSCGKPLPAT